MICVKCLKVLSKRRSAATLCHRCEHTLQKLLNGVTLESARGQQLFKEFLLVDNSAKSETNDKNELMSWLDSRLQK